MLVGQHVKAYQQLVPNVPEFFRLDHLSGPVKHVAQGLRDGRVGDHVRDAVHQADDCVVRQRVHANVHKMLTGIVDYAQAHGVFQYRGQVLMGEVLDFADVLIVRLKDKTRRTPLRKNHIYIYTVV